MVNASQDIPDRPMVPDDKTRILRARLIFEEVLETIQALGVDVYTEHDRTHVMDHISDFDLVISDDREPDLEGIVDGCGDISVVTIGTLSALGVADDSILMEIDENNLRKFKHICPGCKKELKTNSMPVNEETGDKPGERRCLCCGEIWISGHHNEHGKWVKPASHPAPDIAGVLLTQTKNVEDDEVDEAARAY